MPNLRLPIFGGRLAEFRTVVFLRLLLQRRLEGVKPDATITIVWLPSDSTPHVVPCAHYLSVEEAHRHAENFTRLAGRQVDEHIETLSVAMAHAVCTELKMLTELELST